MYAKHTWTAPWWDGRQFVFILLCGAVLTSSLSFDSLYSSHLYWVRADHAYDCWNTSSVHKIKPADSEMGDEAIRSPAYEATGEGEERESNATRCCQHRDSRFVLPSSPTKWPTVPRLLWPSAVGKTRKTLLFFNQLQGRFAVAFSNVEKFRGQLAWTKIYAVCSVYAFLLFSPISPCKVERCYAWLVAYVPVLSGPSDVCWSAPLFHGVHHSSSRHICTLSAAFLSSLRTLSLMVVAQLTFYSVWASAYSLFITCSRVKSTYWLFARPDADQPFIPIPASQKMGMQTGRVTTAQVRLQHLRSDGYYQLYEFERFISIRVYTTGYTGYKIASVLYNLRAVTVDAMINILT